jgi:hypothetical protein
MTERRLTWAGLGSIKPGEAKGGPRPVESDSPPKSDSLSKSSSLSESGMPTADSLSIEQPAAPQVDRLPHTNRPRKSTSPPKSNRLVKSDSLPESDRVSIDKHYGRVLHSVTDVLLPTLPAAAQIVYLQLYRLSYGHGRRTCRIGHPRLAERANLSQSTVRTAVAQLEKRGLVTVVEYRFGGAEQGTTYAVHLPPETPEDAVGLAKSDSLPKINRLPESDSLPESGSMRYQKQSHETAAAGAAPTIYEIRTIGARLFERHRNDVGFDHARLAELVADALAAQGITPHTAMIEEAIKGMRK